MKLSISTKLYFNYTLEETIKRVARQGYPGIEIWGGRPHAYYRDMDSESVSLRGTLANTGEGTISFVPFLQTLNETGYEGFLTVELGFEYTANPDAAAWQSMKIVSSMLKEAN